MLDEGDRKHLVDRTGTAVCGMPAKIGQLVQWGESDCAHCAALYAQRARRLPQ